MQRFCFQLNQFVKQVMKQLILLCVIGVPFFLVSCKKSSSHGDVVSIIGKWNIINDSSYTGVGAGNHLVIYKGKEGDYFNFTSYGKLYIKENAMLHTSSFSLTSDTTLIIDSQTCTITNLPTYDVIISTPIVYSPGGTFGRKITLGK